MDQKNSAPERSQGAREGQTTLDTIPERLTGGRLVEEQVGRLRARAGRGARPVGAAVHQGAEHLGAQLVAQRQVGVGRARAAHAAQQLQRRLAAQPAAHVHHRLHRLLVNLVADHLRAKTTLLSYLACVRPTVN